MERILLLGCSELRNNLTMDKVRVMSTYDVDIARELIRRKKFGAFLLDANWKNSTDIFNFLSRLDFPRRVVVSRKYADETSLSYARKHIGTFLEKPFSGRILKNVLEKVLAKDNRFMYLKEGKQTIDYLLDVPETDRLIECASFIEEKDKYSACLSSQNSCNKMCLFCSTGCNPSRPKNPQNLSVEDILYCIKTVRQLHFEDTSLPQRFNFSGMGEPTENPAIAEIIGELGRDKKYSFKFSTMGPGSLPGFLGELARRNARPGVQFSLHFADEAERNFHMKGTVGNPAEKSLAMLIDFSISAGVKLVVNYAVFEGINDSKTHMDRLKKLLARQTSLSTLIGRDQFVLRLSFPNENKFGHQYRATSSSKMEEISKEVKTSFPVQIFSSLGQEISAGCGQLTASLL